MVPRHGPSAFAAARAPKSCGERSELSASELSPAAAEPEQARRGRAWACGSEGCVGGGTRGLADDGTTEQRDNRTTEEADAGGDDTTATRARARRNTGSPVVM